MEIIAYQKYIRTSPRKLRLVADAVRHMHPSDALVELKFMHKRAAETLRKVLNQAVKNAVNNNKLDERDLSIKHILVEEGPRYRRFRAASRGRARMIMKRSSHVKVVLNAAEKKEEIKEAKKVNKKETSKIRNSKSEIRKDKKS